MPELPEVETTRQRIESALRGRLIKDVTPYWHRTLQLVDGLEISGLIDMRISALYRHGKWLILHLSGRREDFSETNGDKFGVFPGLTNTFTPSDRFLLIHLRMTGHLQVNDQLDPIPRSCRVSLALDNGRVLHFLDSRKFGRMIFSRDPWAVITKVGPDPFSDEFKFDSFKAVLRGSRMKIKPLLLTQKSVAGLGNIYADECCFRAGIRPGRMAKHLRNREVEALFLSIRPIFEEAIRMKGTSFDAVYGGGAYQNRLQVFQRQGLACYRCGTVIKKVRLGGRSTHFCQGCQI